MLDHGMYGMIWLLKEMIIPDKNWQKDITILSASIVLLGLIGYWSPGIIVISQGIQVSPARGGLCIMLNTLGTVLMMATDTQKYFTLKYKPGLIRSVYTYIGTTLFIMVH